MSSHDVRDGQVVEVIIRSPDTVLDDVVLECPNLTWSQVFMAVDRLSRKGILKLTPKGHGIHSVHLSEARGINKAIGKSLP